ncbi:MAG: FxsA family protein [Streptosporangiales bacterium]|nr:FxsA family protein [Streptosporangiales bacterium]
MRRVVLALLAVGVVVLEVVVLVQVAQLIGWWTVPLLLGCSLVGAWLVKREGARAWAALRDAVAAGEAPGRSLADAVVVLAGGLLILVPGLVTTVLGAVAVLPFTRGLAKRAFHAVLGHRLSDLEASLPGPDTTTGPGESPPGPVVEGRVVRRDRSTPPTA